eukprot:9480950-Pyramimonas_sp.AAC.1
MEGTVQKVTSRVCDLNVIRSGGMCTNDGSVLGTDGHERTAVTSFSIPWCARAPLATEGGD